METRSIEDIKADMRIGLKHLRYAIAQAAKEGQPGMAVVANKPDGGGRIITTFDTELVDDLAILLDMPAQTEEDNREVATVALGQRIKASGMTLRVTPLVSDAGAGARTDTAEGVFDE
jgi:hypothetical protein